MRSRARFFAHEAVSIAKRGLGAGRSVTLSALSLTKRCVVTTAKLARLTAIKSIQTTYRSIVISGRLAHRTLISVIEWLRKLPTAVTNFGRFLWWTILAGTISKRLRLVVAFALFIGWMCYLGYAALTKSHGPIVSHAQAAAAEVAVVTEVQVSADAKPDMKVKVVEALSPGAPPPGTDLYVVNLPEVRGFEGPGQYLLLLLPDNFFRPKNGNVLPPFLVVGQLRSPGNDLSGVGKPAIYRWNEDVRKQYEKLHR